MQVLSLLLLVLAGIVVDTLWVALFRAHAVGKFKITRDGSAIFQFESDLGSFSILPKEGRLSFKKDGASQSIERSDIRGLEYRTHESGALLQEFFFGFDLTDLMTRYRDTVEWFSLTVVTHDGQRIPLFASGQYRQREFLMSWYIDAQTALLERLGLLIDVEKQSRHAMETIRSRLGGPELL